MDIIFSPSGGPVTDELLDRADDREVMAMRLPVSSMEDVLTTKLLALTEQEPDYGPVLEVARTLREQIHWDEVRERTESLTVREGVLHPDRGARDPSGGRPAAGLEVELPPGGPPVVGARDDRARLDDPRRRAVAELLDVARLRVLHLDLRGPSGVPRRDRGQVESAFFAPSSISARALTGGSFAR